MKKLFFILFSMFLFINTVNADKLDLISKNAILYNVEEDKIMYSKKPNEKVAIASLTKVMATMVILDNIEDLDKKINFDKIDYTKLRYLDLTVSTLNRYKEYTYKDFIYSFIMESSADCGYALVYEICDTEEDFSKMMNDKAKEIGMNNSNFNNPVGLDHEKHYSTMSDMLILMKEALKNEFLKEVMSTFEYKVSDGTIINHTIDGYMKHFDLELPYLKGGKTGYNDVPGYALMSYANKTGSTYILVTTNAKYEYSSPNHLKDAKKVYEYYFKNYGYHKIIKENDIILKLNTKYSDKKTVTIKADKDITVYLKNNYDKSKIKTDYEGIKTITPENKKGQKLGILNIYYKDELLDKIDIYLNDKISYNLTGLLNNYKYIIIAIISYTSIIVSTYLIVKRIKKSKGYY